MAGIVGGWERAQAVLAGRYRLDELIGRGGTGEVWRGHDLRPGWPVAVKILSPQVTDVSMRERFAREARTAARVVHPNVVTVFDVGEHEGRPFLVMELLTGRDLATELAEDGPPGISAMCRLAGQAAVGLDAAHRAGVVHRDVKPANLHRSGDGALKVVDFGTARVATEAATRLTSGGDVVGTAAYLSPEQILGEAGDAASDLYALGCVCYELLCGRPPFVGPAADLISQHVRSLPEPPRRHRPDVPVELERLVLALLEKDPAARPPSGEVVRRVLAGVARQVAPRARDGAAPPPPEPEPGPPARAWTTEAPSTRAWTTEAPSTRAWTTEAPSTRARSTEAPSTRARSTEAPSTRARSTEALSTEARSTEVRSREVRRVDARSTEAPSTRAWTAEARSTEAGAARDWTAEARSTEVWAAEAWTARARTGEAARSAESVPGRLRGWHVGAGLGVLAALVAGALWTSAPPDPAGSAAAAITSAAPSATRSGPSGLPSAPPSPSRTASQSVSAAPSPAPSRTAAAQGWRARLLALSRAVTEQERRGGIDRKLARKIRGKIAKIAGKLQEGKGGDARDELRELGRDLAEARRKGRLASEGPLLTFLRDSGFALASPPRGRGSDDD
ncbi:serine/threonine-protein kinase PknD [Streptosporangium roseum]|uniref:non-specific serine/threonine protein kinase n=2 Tax=Streptosporangium roseum TaxID=2001 RepID=D2B1F1_STRRD|nr:Serine/threonine protein kinase-like protein [Streptosporangium roseum DSM 43021]